MPDPGSKRSDMATHTEGITDTTFEREVLKAGEAVLADFWADWCGPCRMVAPLLDQIAEEQNSRSTRTRCPRSSKKLRSVPNDCAVQGRQSGQPIIGYLPRQTS